MITMTYASILGLIYVALGMRVVRGRVRSRVGLGDGGNAGLERDIRIHGNFAEYVPLAIILMALLESGGGPGIVIRGLGGTLVIARLLHIWGLTQSTGTSFGRVAGTVLTFLVILTASLLGLYKALT